MRETAVKRISLFLEMLYEVYDDPRQRKDINIIKATQVIIISIWCEVVWYVTKSRDSNILKITQPY